MVNFFFWFFWWPLSLLGIHEHGELREEVGQHVPAVGEEAGDVLGAQGGRGAPWWMRFLHFLKTCRTFSGVKLLVLAACEQVDL